MSIYNDQQYSEHASRAHRSDDTLEPGDPRNGTHHSWLHPIEPQQTPQRQGAAIYLLGMGVATIIGSAFVIGGMFAEPEGFTALALAATVPLTALLWAVTLSIVRRD